MSGLSRREHEPQTTWKWLQLALFAYPGKINKLMEDCISMAVERMVKKIERTVQ